MNEYKEDQEGYARFTPSGNKVGRITAYVKITKVNGEYLEIEDNDDFKYKVRKDKFYFVEEMF